MCGSRRWDRPTERCAPMSNTLLFIYCMDGVGVCSCLEHSTTSLLCVLPRKPFNPSLTTSYELQASLHTIMLVVCESGGEAKDDLTHKQNRPACPHCYLNLSPEGHAFVVLLPVDRHDMTLPNLECFKVLRESVARGKHSLITNRAPWRSVLASSCINQCPLEGPSVYIILVDVVTL